MQQDKMISYRVTVSYKGTHYSGWQFQTDNSSTVQEKLEKVISEIVNYKKFKIAATSRTDRGVHSKEQVLRIDIPKEIDTEYFKKGMNTKLPSDIRITKIQKSQTDFNPNRECESKEYHYYFINNKSSCATLSDSILYVEENLNIELMQEACNFLVGKHDFKNLCIKGSQKANFLRELTVCTIEMTSFIPQEEKIYYLRVKSSGFFKYMVRFIMGALLEVGKENISLTELSNYIKADIPGPTIKKAPAHGLLLYELKF